jgi:hypothetical protein
VISRRSALSSIRRARRSVRSRCATQLLGQLQVAAGSLGRELFGGTHG